MELLRDPRRRERATDGVVAVVAGAITAFPEHRYFDLGVPYALPIAVVVVVGTVAVRRRYPVVALAGVLAGWVIASSYFAAIIAMYTVGTRFRSWYGVAAAGVGGAVALGVPIWADSGRNAAVLIVLLFCGAPLLFGRYVSTRRALIASYKEHAQRVERQQRQRIERARHAERSQIARDMHDVVTHRVALIVLHATALEATRGKDAAALAAQIGGIGRETLRELRELVTVLRGDEEEAPLRPQPGLDDLEELVERSRAAGTPVQLDADASGDTVPALVQHTLYRVAQESMSNVHKHAPGATTLLRWRHHGTEVSMTISNAHTAVPSGLPSGGHGLLGISERVKLVGGELSTSNSDDRFEVLVRIPLTQGKVA